MASYSSLPPSRTSTRNKKPSNYAKYIEEYQQQVIHSLSQINPKSTKKLKSEFELSNDLPISISEPKKTKKYIPCVLPDGKRLNLEILFSKAKPPVKAKPKPKKEIVEQNMTTEKKPTPPDNNLLSKFLFAFQEIEKNEKEVENDSAKNGNSADIQIQNKKEPKELRKKEKDEDDKFAKYYDKLKKLDEKFIEVS